MNNKILNFINKLKRFKIKYSFFFENEVFEIKFRTLKI
jgi:hypothetical protein